MKLNIKVTPLFKIAMIATVALLLSSCTKDKLHQYIDAYNDLCPYNSEFGVITGLDVDDKQLTFNITADEKTIPLEKFKSNPEVVKTGWLVNFVGSKDATKADFINLIANSGRGIVLNFSNDNDKKFAININNKELVANLKKKITDDEEVDHLIKLNRLTLPKQLDAATTMTDLKLEGDYMIYYYDINEDVLTIEEMNNNTSTYRDIIINGMKGEFANPDSPMAYFFGLIGKMNKGLRYSYHGTKSGNTLDIDITNAELKQVAATAPQPAK